MDIKLPPIEEQKKIVKKKEQKIRTSFEFTEGSLQLLEKEAEKEGLPPSEIFRRIIEGTHIDTKKHKKRLKNLTVFKVHMEKLEKIGREMVPDSWRGKRGVNRSGVAELLIKEYFKSR